MKKWNFKRRLCAFYSRIKPHFTLVSKRNALSDDLRKIGVYAIGLGLVALIVAGDKITEAEALAIEVTGFILWIAGLLFKKEDDQT